MNLAHCIRAWAAQRPDAVAIGYADRTISYRALDAQIDACAWQLRGAQVSRGDRVAYLGLNHPHILVVLLALARIGAIFTPLNVRLAPAEHAFQLQDSGARLLIHDAAFSGHVQATGAAIGASAQPPIARVLETDWLPAIEAQARRTIARAAPDSSAIEVGSLDDDLLLVYTSGTTGKPKGAVLTQNALLWNCINSIHAHSLTSADHILMALPLFHVGGLNIMTLPALYVGAKVTLHARFEPDRFLGDLSRLRPTLTILVPAAISALLAHPDWFSCDLSSLRMINTGSSIVPLSLIEPWLRRRVPVGQVYGSTETCPIAIYLRAEDAFRKAGSAGLPALHCEVRLCDANGAEGAAGIDVPDGQVGEIWIRGPNLMRGYFGNPRASAAVFVDDWYRTGDLAYRDYDGYYWVVGRSRDVIISGGENIYPAELEAILADCPALAESAVVGLPDKRWGEVPVAVVVLKTGQQLDLNAVLRLFEGKLARFKHPKQVIEVASLPKTALGKIQKTELLRQIS